VSSKRAWSEEDALAQRLKAQGLDRRAPASALVRACGAMGGAQAQVGSAARLSLAARVGDAHGARARQMLENSWGGVFHTVTSQGLICFGPSAGGQTTFVRVDTWLGAPLKLRDRAEAEAEIARRFLLAYGPATVGDFAYWAGLYVPPARRMWERIAGEMRPVTVGGKPAFVHESVKAPPRARGADPHVRLLPNFDAYLLGHKGKDACVEPARYKKVFKNAGWISPVVLVDGRVRGTWSLERGTRGLVVRVAAFKPLSRAEREGVAREAEEVAAFAGLAARVRYGKSARPKAKVAWTGP